MNLKNIKTQISFIKNINVGVKIQSKRASIKSAAVKTFAKKAFSPEKKRSNSLKIKDDNLKKNSELDIVLLLQNFQIIYEELKSQMKNVNRIIIYFLNFFFLLMAF